LKLAHRSRGDRDGKGDIVICRSKSRCHLFLLFLGFYLPQIEINELTPVSWRDPRRVSRCPGRHQGATGRRDAGDDGEASEGLLRAPHDDCRKRRENRCAIAARTVRACGKKGDCPPKARGLSPFLPQALGLGLPRLEPLWSEGLHDLSFGRMARMSPTGPLAMVPPWRKDAVKTRRRAGQAGSSLGEPRTAEKNTPNVFFFGRVGRTSATESSQL